MKGTLAEQTKERVLILNSSDLYKGSLILVNRAHGIRGAASEPKLVRVSEGGSTGEPEIYLEAKAARAFQKLLQAVCGGKGIVSVSGYRPGQEQRQIYADSLRENGAEFTEKFVALPGHSEHESGYAIDVGLEKEDIDFIRPDFPYEGICQTFRKTAPLYGFVERYPRGRETVTGIAHEPWHFRYVGYPHARVMAERGLTLEEYHDFLRRETCEAHPLEFETPEQDFAIYFVPAGKDGKTNIHLPGELPVQVLGNNADGFVVTVWRDGV